MRAAAFASGALPGCHALPKLPCGRVRSVVTGSARPAVHVSSKNIFISVATNGVGARLLAGRGTFRRRQPRAAVQTRAMVNVDVSPSVILGVGLIGAGVSLWQIRQAKPWISKDYDVVVSCISLLVGGILIFQVRRGALVCCLLSKCVLHHP